MEEAKALGLPFPEADLLHPSTSTDKPSSSGRAKKSSSAKPPATKRQTSSSTIANSTSARGPSADQKPRMDQDMNGRNGMMNSNGFNGVPGPSSGQGARNLEVRDFAEFGDGYEQEDGYPNLFGLNRERGERNGQYGQEQGFSSMLRGGNDSNTRNGFEYPDERPMHNNSGAAPNTSTFQSSGFAFNFDRQSGDGNSLSRRYYSGTAPDIDVDPDVDQGRSRAYYMNPETLTLGTGNTQTHGREYEYSLTNPLGGGLHSEESYMRTPVVSPTVGQRAELPGFSTSNRIEDQDGLRALRQMPGSGDGSGGMISLPNVRQLEEYLRPNSSTRSNRGITDVFDYGNSSLKTGRSPFSTSLGIGAYAGTTSASATAAAGLLGLSPGTFDKTGLNYLNTPSEADNNMDVTMGGTSNMPAIGNIAGTMRSGYQPGLATSQRGVSVIADTEGGPSTGGSNRMILPIHELQSGTLGEIGNPQAVPAPTYTSPAALNFNASSPHISSLLNPDPIPRNILPTFTQPRNPIDAILPRPLLHLILGLFKDFIYPLTPCIHMPTLLQDLARRRELEADQEEWIALVLATVMSTIVQVPRAFVPLSRSEVSALAEKCHIETRKWTMRGYPDNITVNAG